MRCSRRPSSRAADRGRCDLCVASRSAGGEPRALRQAARCARGDREWRDRASRRPTRSRPAQIRVMVEPTEVQQRYRGACSRTHDRPRIEDQLEYPGQVKVIVIRESRANRGGQVTVCYLVGATSRVDEAVPRHHVRLPDERPRLRADQGHARGARARRGAARRRTPTCLSSTRARSGRSRTSASPPTSRRRGRASGSDPDKVIAVGGCYAEAQRERHLRALPASRRRLRPRLDPAPRRLARRRRRGRRARPLRARRAHFAGELPMHRERRVPGLGPGLDGLQLQVLVLHRPGGARPRAEPPAGRHRRRGDAPRRARACEEITLLGQNVNSWGRDLLPDSRPSSASCCAPATRSTGIERIRFTSPHPKDFREPGHRRDGRVRRGLRARRTCRSSRARPGS